MGKVQDQDLLDLPNSSDLMFDILAAFALFIYNFRDIGPEHGNGMDCCLPDDVEVNSEVSVYDLAFKET